MTNEESPTPDPWNELGLFPGTRFVCPFEDWWHDERDDYWPDEIPADVTHGLTTLAEMSHAITVARLTAKNRRIDGQIRRHLESHTLEEWFAVAVKLHQVQRSAKVLSEVAAPDESRVTAAVYAGDLTINDGRWIRAAAGIVDALKATEAAADA